MEIRSVLVALDPRASSASSLGPVIDLAQRFAARVSVCAAAQPRLDFAEAGVGSAAAAEYERQRREINEGLTTLEAAFETVPTTVRGRFLGLIAPLTACLLDNMASADLVILPSNGLRGRLRDVDAGELIVASGRPVLVIPEDTAQVRSQHIVVAWKDSREARRAVADSLPFLKMAEDVFIVSVDEGDHREGRDSFRDVMTWMEMHGIRASGDLVPLRSTVGEAIEDAAAERKAEFIVSGGYGHARLREWLFGGVTRELLASTGRCRFFSN